MYIDIDLVIRLYMFIVVVVYIVVDVFSRGIQYVVINKEICGKSVILIGIEHA